MIYNFAVTWHLHLSRGCHVASIFEFYSLCAVSTIMTHAFKLCRMLSHRANFTVAVSGSTGFFDGPRLPDMSMFSFYPTFFNEDEQKVLLSSCLKKLDTAESRRAKRRRLQTPIPSSYPFGISNSISDLFRPDDMYEFQNVSP